LTRRFRAALRPEWSSRNFDIILLARIAMSAGRALAGVLTPIYLALQGFSALELSEYVIAVALASAILSAVIGMAADYVGRRIFLIVVPLLTALAGTGFAFSPDTVVLFGLGALGSFGRGSGAGSGTVGPYLPAESAFVAESVPAAHRNSAFGRLTFGSSLGALAGSLLALLAPSTHLHGPAATAAFRAGFLAIAVTSAIAGLLAVALSEPSSPRRQRARSARQDRGLGRGTGQGRRHGLGWLSLPRRSRWLVYRLWITNTTNGLAVGMFGPFVTYWFFRRFGASAPQVGVVFAVINAATMVSSLSAARLARRWGLVRTVFLVRAAQALLLVPMVLAPTFALAAGAYFVRMVVQRIGLPLRQSYAVGLAHPDERAAVSALSNLPSQLVMSGSPAITGYLMDEVSLSLPFELAAILQFVNATSFWLLFRRHPPQEELDRQGSPAPQAVRSRP
jgi:MFS family permease